MSTKEEKIKKIGFEQLDGLVGENVINILYNRYVELENVIQLENKTELTKDDKMKILGLTQHEELLADGHVNQFYEKYIELRQCSGFKMFSKINQNLRKKKKEQLLLKLLNGVLVNLGKPEVDEITKFADVTREDLGNDSHMTTFKDIEQEIYYTFESITPRDFQYGVKVPILTVIKKLTKDLGYKLISTKDFKTVGTRKLGFITYHIGRVSNVSIVDPSQSNDPNVDLPQQNKQSPSS